MNINRENTGLIIPTFNPGEKFKVLLESLKNQTLVPKKLLIIDSESTDSTIKIAESFGFSVYSIKKNEFNHGGTRQLGVNLLEENIEYILFITQDIIFNNNDAIEILLRNFENDSVGAVYGRQLPHKNAKLIAAHARLFNYSNESSIKSKDDIPKFGIKTAFISNSFAAYRRKALNDIGGFPNNVILSEDTFVAAKMLLNGWKIAYCAEAQVFHSHNYNYIEEFRRYFDIGVFHSREKWIRKEFGGAEGEGVRFIWSEINYLLQHNLFLIPSALLRSIIKAIAYKLGFIEQIIPLRLKSKISLSENFWRI